MIMQEVIGLRIVLEHLAHHHQDLRLPQLVISTLVMLRILSLTFGLTRLPNDISVFEYLL